MMGALGTEGIGKYISEKSGMKVLLSLIRFVLIVFLLLFSV